MGCAFTKDLRERAVKAYLNGLGTLDEVANIFDIGRSTLEKYLRIYRRHGDLTPGKSSGRPRIFTDEHLAVLKQLILSSPSARLVDYCFEFEKKTGIKISKSTIWDACQQLNIRRKKKLLSSRTIAS